MSLMLATCSVVVAVDAVAFGNCATAAAVRRRSYRKVEGIRLQTAAKRTLWMYKLDREI
jgi:hypothetical protein